MTNEQAEPGDDTGHGSGTLMLREAGEGGTAAMRFMAENAAALARIGVRLRARPPAAVVTCARGSSDHAATYAKYMIETHLGVPTSSAALSVSSMFDSVVAAGDTLCIAISQSGRSADLLASVEAHRRSGAFVVALVNDASSPLAAMSHEVLPLRAGPELSVAATKSYIAALAGIASLVSAWSQDRALDAALDLLPGQLEVAFRLDWSAALPRFSEGRSLFVIGRGYGFAVAQEAALKMKETCRLHAEAYSSAEVRHGPMTIVGEGFPVLAFATSDEAGVDVRTLVREFEARGASIALADPLGGGLPAVRSLPALEPILMVQSFYRFANALSLLRGLDPDAPPHLEKVTSTR